MTRKFKILLLAAICAGFAIEDATWSIGMISLSFVSQAEARVGRPLTPVSVAGVGRRTRRRCRNGTYNC